MGMGSRYEVDRDAALTVPEEAVEFVKQTSVDCLAVAVGTAHGMYSGTPKLDFDRLASSGKWSRYLWCCTVAHPQAMTTSTGQPRLGFAR